MNTTRARRRPIRPQDLAASPQQRLLWDEMAAALVPPSTPGGEGAGSVGAHRPVADPSTADPIPADHPPAEPTLLAQPQAPHRPAQHARFIDCSTHGPQSELILVEGDSALASVAAVRNPQTQALLALQGKPLNAWTARAERVAAHPQYRQLADALGLASPVALGLPSRGPAPASGPWPAAHPALARYGRLVLLFDPDADGIHIGALMVLYVLRWLPGLIEAGALLQVRPPMFELIGASDGQLRHASHPEECEALKARMAADAGGQPPRVRRFRGLGNLPTALLREQAVDPTTRVGHRIDRAGAQLMQQMLSGGSPS